MKKIIQSVEDLEKMHNLSRPVQISQLRERYSVDDGEVSMKKGDNSNLLSDQGRAEEDILAGMQQEFLLSKLTRRQRKVVIIMTEERKRRKIAVRLGVSLQAVNQIIIRIRQRIEIYQAMAE